MIQEDFSLFQPCDIIDFALSFLPGNPPHLNANVLSVIDAGLVINQNYSFSVILAITGVQET
jgi:hypothetical protein